MSNILDHDRKYVTLLKGVAIFAVVILHILTAIPTAIYKDPAFFPTFIVLDQLGRFCVPLFIALSGFGLAKRYLHPHIHLGEFFKRRVLKLLPLYLLWSIASLFILSLTPVWRQSITQEPLLEKLLWGRADYHLYFVPMIFQLYLLFPILYWIQKKSWKVLLVLSLALQIGAFLLYAEVTKGTVEVPFMLNDQRQYVFFGSWIFYFVLGMIYARKESENLMRRKIIGGVALLVGAFWCILTGRAALEHGADPIAVLRFTRFPILLFATGVITLLLHRISRFSTPLHHAGLWMGKHSYLIYLAHPLFLRIVLARTTQTAEFSHQLIAASIFVGAWIISVKVLSE